MQSARRRTRATPKPSSAPEGQAERGPKKGLGGNAVGGATPNAWCRISGTGSGCGMHDTHPNPSPRPFALTPAGSPDPARTLSADRAQRRQLLVVEVELHDLLHAAAAQAHGHVHVEVLDAVLAVDVRAHAHDLVRVAQDGLHHLGDGRAGRVVGAAGLRGAPPPRRRPSRSAARPAATAASSIELGDGGAVHRGEARPAHHALAVRAHGPAPPRPPARSRASRTPRTTGARSPARRPCP